MIRFGWGSISGMVSALAAILVIADVAMPHVKAPLAHTAMKADRLAQPVSATKDDVGMPAARRGSDHADLRLVSLDSGVPLSDPAAAQPALAAAPIARTLFEERFFFDPPLISIERLFLNVTTPDAAVPDQPAQAQQPREMPPAVPAAPVREPATRPVPRQPATKLATIQPAALATTVKKNLGAGDGAKESPPSPEVEDRTAIYDITAQAVYLPNGKKLEAHSGLGSHLDNPRSISLKGQGPTPPNVYRLALREKLFHGVRAIRLLPADEDKMFGRDGMLAHSYLLGPNGQSNGCVSFSDYPAFLNAYLNGEIDRLVVVERLDRQPGQQPASQWIAEAIGSLFKPAASLRDDVQSDNRGSVLSYQ